MSILEDQTNTFKFGGDGHPLDVSSAVIVSVTIGNKLTWIKAYVSPGTTPHLVSRCWLSRHRCLVEFDPSSQNLQSP